MKHMIFAAALASGAIAAPILPAHAQSFEASRIIDSFDADNLGAVVARLDGTVEAKENGEFLVRFSNNTAATGKFTACNDGRCRGFTISGRFGKPSDKTDEEIVALATAFNRRWSAGKSYLTGDNRPVVQSYMIADGGISMENWRVQLSVYSSMLLKMREAIYTGG